MDELRRAVENWIRAEYQFRCGGSAYQPETTEWYLKAERKLRRCLTGKGSLEKACSALGGVNEIPERERMKA